jgi:hypothetical protein
MLGDRWGYIDQKGDLIVNFKFDFAAPFSEGLAAVHSRGLAGYIDHYGRYVVQPEYGVATDFSRGIAVVSKGSAWYCIRRDGKVIWPSA